MTADKCPSCGIGTLLKLELGVKRCRNCDKYFKKGQEVEYTINGDIRYKGDRGQRQRKDKTAQGFNDVVTTGGRVNQVAQILRDTVGENEVMAISLRGDRVTATYTDYKLLKKVLEEISESRKELAELTTIDSAVISRYMSGKQKVTEAHHDIFKNVLGKKARRIFRQEKHTLDDLYATEQKESNKPITKGAPITKLLPKLRPTKREGELISLSILGDEVTANYTNVDKLKAELTKINPSMRQLSQQLGITSTLLSSYASGRQKVPLHDREMLTRLLGQEVASEIFRTAIYSLAALEGDGRTPSEKRKDILKGVKERNELIMQALYKGPSIEGSFQSGHTYIVEAFPSRAKDGERYVIQLRTLNREHEKEYASLEAWAKDWILQDHVEWIAFPIN